MGVLVLNADFNCINNVSWQRAYNLIHSAKAEVVKYGEQIVYNITRTHSFRIPKVIRLLKFVSSVYLTNIPYCKKNVLIRDKNTCQYCGCMKNRMTIDHIVPVSKGGRSSWTNCVAACHDCNGKKADKSLEQSGLKLRSRPKAPTILQYNKNKFAIEIEKILASDEFLW